MLHHDVDKGQVIHEGEPRWRATRAAVDRVTGEKLSWTCVRGRGHVVTLENGKPVAVLRHFPSARRWQVRIEGFEFHGWNRVLGKERYDPVKGFDRIADAKKFVKTVLTQAHARF